MHNNSSTFVPNIAKLQSFDYECIIQTLITKTDIIWLPALAMDVNSLIIKNKLTELIEAGLIKLWDYETQLSKNNNTINRIITKEENDEIEMCRNQLINEMFSNTTDFNSSDYTIVNIEKKNIITSQLLAECCQANSILKRTPNISPNLETSPASNDLLQLYSKYIFGQSNIINLSELGIDDIVELRKLSKYYRAKVFKYIERHKFSVIPNEQIKEDCLELQNEYDELVNDVIKKNCSNSEISKDISLEFFSLFISWVSLITVPQSIIESITNRNDRGFVMYMYKLNRGL